MTYKEFLNKLEWDTSEEDFEFYISGVKKLPINLKKFHDKIYAQLPALYEQQKKQNINFGRDLVGSKLFKLAFFKLGYTGYRDRCNENKITTTLGKTVDIMKKIVDSLNYGIAKGTINKNAQYMYREYCEKD